jgi:hypothetical protein
MIIIFSGVPFYATAGVLLMEAVPDIVTEFLGGKIDMGLAELLVREAEQVPADPRGRVRRDAAAVVLDWFHPCPSPDVS